MSAKAELLFMGLVALRIILDPWSLFTLESLYYFLLVAGIFVFFRFFLLHISYHSLTNKVSIRGCFVNCPMENQSRPRSGLDGRPSQILQTRKSGSGGGRNIDDYWP